jgi:hypothetical protein
MTLGDPVNINLDRKTGRKWYIGQRDNPQFDKPYFVAYGQLSKTEVKAKEKSLYGSMYLTGFATQQEYESKINDLRNRGFRVTER